MERQFNFQELHAIVATLRSEQGCPWDRAQTHETLKGTTIEEAYEVNQAVDELLETRKADHLKEELGDLLLQVLLHSQIAEEDGEFTLEDVIDGIARKMIRRHPHVFGGKTYESIEEQKEDWERLKAMEKGHESDCPASELEEVPGSFPALLRGQKVMKKALKYNLVSQEDEIILKDMLQSVVDLQIAMSKPEEEGNRSEYLGKSLMAILRMAAKYRINAEVSLTEAIDHFIKDCSKE